GRGCYRETRRSRAAGRRLARWNTDRRPRTRRSGTGRGLFFPNSRDENVALAIEGQRCDFFFSCAVQDESISSGRNSIDEAAAIGAGDYVSLRIESEYTDVSLIALEKQRVLAFGRDFENLAVVTCRDVQRSGFVEQKIPDIFCSRG